MVTCYVILVVMEWLRLENENEDGWRGLRSVEVVVYIYRTQKGSRRLRERETVYERYCRESSFGKRVNPLFEELKVKAPEEVL